MRQNTLERQAMIVMRKYPEARNSDIKLTQHLWYEFYRSRVHLDDNNRGYVYMRDLFELPREDNIKRVRAKIQNDKGLLLPTDFEIMQKRKEASKSWREYLGYDDPTIDWQRHCIDNAQLEKQLKTVLTKEGADINQQGSLL